MKKLNRTISLDFTMSESFINKCNSELKTPANNIAEWVSKDLQKRFTKIEWLEAEMHCNIRPFDVLVVKKSGSKNCEIVFRDEK